MPKNISIGKTMRKPLNDISNGRKSSNRPGKKKISDENDDNALDRLLLAHSDLSNIIRQIDELIVQALKVKVTSKEGRKEIKSFTNVLNDMHESLKSWFPRFQNSLSTSSTDSENQGGQSLPGKTVPTAIKEGISDVAHSPELELGSRISPSPLVSWCNDHNVESGRQLFLLTPLPTSKDILSKNTGLSRLLFERKMDVPSDTIIEQPPLLTASENASDDLLERAEVKPLVSNISEISEMESTRHSGFTSPPKFSKREHAIYLMTPGLKTSPPKSCLLLEPSFLQKYNDIPKSTKFSVGNQDCSLSHTSEPSNLALKYSECYELQTHKFGNARKEVEALPDYFISPPKSCVLMEPPGLSSKPEMQSTRLTSVAKSKDLKEACLPVKELYNQELVGGSMALVDSTPMLKVGRGKPPGENTLKRELWTKFEAASSNVLRLDKSVLLETSRKGFLDKLEEVSCENASSATEGL